MKRKTKIYIASTLLIAVLGVVVLIIQVTTTIRSRLHEAREINAEAQLTDLRTAIDNYHHEYGVYPAGSREHILEVLTGNNDQGIKFYAGWREDIWRVPLRLKPASQGSKPTFYSSGPDKIDNQCAKGSDDIELIEK